MDGVVLRPPPPPPPPHPATARVSNNPAVSGSIADCHRLRPGRFLRTMAHAIAARSKASINRPLRPGDRGGTGGRGPECGASADVAVVEQVTVILVPSAAGFGETPQVAPEGAPVTAAKLTVPVNPPSPPTFKV